jgi:hypothetical protein
MTFDAKVYLANLSMHGPSGNLSELESKAVWTELQRRMGGKSEKEVAPETTGGEDGTA